MKLERSAEDLKNLAEALGEHYSPTKESDKDHSAAYTIIIPIKGFVLRFWIDERNQKGTLKIRKKVHDI